MRLVSAQPLFKISCISAHIFSFFFLRIEWRLIIIDPGHNCLSFEDMNNSHYYSHNYDLFHRYYEERPFVFLLTVLKQVFLGLRESPLHFFTVPLFSPLEDNCHPPFLHHHHPNHLHHDLEHQVGWPGLAVQVMQVMLVFDVPPSSDQKIVKMMRCWDWFCQMWQGFFFLNSSTSEKILSLCPWLESLCTQVWYSQLKWIGHLWRRWEVEGGQLGGGSWSWLSC